MRARSLKSNLWCVLALVGLLFARRALADGVTTGVNCNGIAAGGSSCSYGTEFSSQGLAKGTSSASASLNSFGGTASISVSAESLDGIVDPVQILFAPASATADIHFSLSTPGPVRPGYLDLSFSHWLLSSGGDGSVITESLSIGGFHEQCGARGFQTYLCFNPPMPQIVSGTEFLVPFVLGQPYNFDFSITATADDGDFDFPSAVGAVTVKYQITDAPEPSTWGLIAVVIALLGVLYPARRIRNKSSLGN